MIVHRFYEFSDDDAAPRCRVCAGLPGRHEATCALMALRVQVQELGSQLALYVATMRELLDDVDAIVRGDRDVR